MKKIGIVSYNRYANFTNYGSALQSFGLYTAINKISDNRWKAILVNYCPDVLKDKNPLNPIKNMWDKDQESRKMCELSMPAIKVNYDKFVNFYDNTFLNSQKYTSENFNLIKNEGITSFVCGSDTIFCIDEFGFDDGYYANYDVMKKNYTFSYAASFGDATFDKQEDYEKLIQRLHNFKALGLREDKLINDLKAKIDCPIQRVIDPTLLLETSDYDRIVHQYKNDKKYILLYARRYNSKMEAYADYLAKKHNLEVIEISLRAINNNKHKMFYEAGVEEFLGLVKNAEYVITNSYHGIIFSMIFEKEFIGFSREQCGNKIRELLLKVGLEDRLIVNGDETMKEINYLDVKDRINDFRKESLKYLERQLIEASKC